MKIQKNKCYSACDQGQRNKSDFYQTPYSITEQLLENEKFDYNKTVLEPCCGDGAIITVLCKHTDEVYYYDIKPNFYLYQQKSFLLQEIEKYDYIITNPPFSKAFEFIQKAKQVAKEKFAMLLPLNYLHGQKRYENKIFIGTPYPLTKIYVFTRYPPIRRNCKRRR